MNRVNVGTEAALTLYHEYIGCEACSLCNNRRGNDIIPGFGSVTADIMIITDTPSEKDGLEMDLLTDEDGDLLLELLDQAWGEGDPVLNGIRKMPDWAYLRELREYFADRIFFTALTACPSLVKVTKKQAEACRDRVQRLIYAVDPLVVISLGEAPGKHIMGTSGKVSKSRNIVWDFSVPSPFSSKEVRYAGLVTYHPRTLGACGDAEMAANGTGMHHEAIQDFEKVIKIVRAHKEILNVGESSTSSKRTSRPIRGLPKNRGTHKRRRS